MNVSGALHCTASPNEENSCGQMGACKVALDGGTADSVDSRLRRPSGGSLLRDALLMATDQVAKGRDSERSDAPSYTARCHLGMATK